MMISLEAVAKQPDLARGVPRDTLMRAMMACVLALCGDPKPAEAIDRALSDTMTTEEAARLIGIAKRTLAHGARTKYLGLLLPTGTRRLAFSRKAIEAWQRQSASYDRPSSYHWLNKKRG